MVLLAKRFYCGRRLPTQKVSVAVLIAGYFVFRGFHEICQVVPAYILDLHHGVLDDKESILSFLLRITFGRAVHLPLLMDANDESVALVEIYPPTGTKDVGTGLVLERFGGRRW